MKIDKVKIKNFYCFVDAELDFSKYTGLTLIKELIKIPSGQTDQENLRYWKQYFLVSQGRQ